MNGLQHRKHTYDLARKALSIANTLGGRHQARALALLNKHRNELRWAQRGGRTPTYCPHFETVVSGIPCGVVIEEWTHGSVCYFLVDRKGYRADWLEARMSDADKAQLLEELEAEHERLRDEY